MVEDKSIKINNNGSEFLGIVLLIIMFWGAPDIADAIIHFLMRAQ